MSPDAGLGRIKADDTFINQELSNKCKWLLVAKLDLVSTDVMCNRLIRKWFGKAFDG